MVPSSEMLYLRSRGQPDIIIFNEWSSNLLRTQEKVAVVVREANKEGFERQLWTLGWQCAIEVHIQSRRRKAFNPPAKKVPAPCFRDNKRVSIGYLTNNFLIRFVNRDALLIVVNLLENHSFLPLIIGIYWWLGCWECDVRFSKFDLNPPYMVLPWAKDL